MRIPVTERRRALVAAAIRVIVRDGVAGATTRAVVAEAGMKLASFHYAFDSRDELMGEVVAAVTEQEGTEAEAAFLPVAALGDDEASMVQVVLAGLDRYIDLLVADPSREQALLELSLYALRGGGADGSARLQHDAYLRVARRALKNGAAATGRRWTTPVEQAARLLVVILDGLTTTWLADRDTASARQSARFAAIALARLTESDPATPAADQPIPPSSRTARTEEQPA